MLMLEGINASQSIEALIESTIIMKREAQSAVTKTYCRRTQIATSSSPCSVIRLKARRQLAQESSMKIRTRITALCLTPNNTTKIILISSSRVPNNRIVDSKIFRRELKTVHLIFRRKMRVSCFRHLWDRMVLKSIASSPCRKRTPTTMRIPFRCGHLLQTNETLNPLFFQNTDLLL